LPGSLISPLECSEFRAFLQHADRVLTMKACHLDEFVKDFFLLFASAGSIASRHRLNQFTPCRHTQLPPQ